MKKLTIPITIALGFILAGFGYRYFSATTQLNEKIYIAVEGEGKIVVVDPLTKEVIRNIDLSREHEGDRLSYAPHNVQVSPDGKTVWVTNLLSGDVSIIDTSLDKEVRRIPVGKEPNGISFWQKK